MMFHVKHQFDVDMVYFLRYYLLGGDFMEKPTRVTVGLSPGILDKLDRICSEKGLKRPAAISIAIEKLWKEEYADQK